MTTEFSAEVAAVNSGPSSVFLLTVPDNFPMQHTERVKRVWDNAWERAGRSAPPIFVMPASMKLTALADAELKELGLMRIPAEVC